MGHRVTLEARRRGAIVRPLGDTVVLMPPPAISKRDLERLVEITSEAIRAAVRGAYGEEPAPLERIRRGRRGAVAGDVAA
jgi:adenosylmethionine-8-amino-7-oxononanoate aminotransferase